MLIFLLTIALLNSVILIVILKKNSAQNNEKNFSDLNSKLENILSLMREEARNSRLESSNHAKSGREEINNNFKNLGESLNSNLTHLSNFQKTQLEAFALKLREFSDSQRQKFNDLLLKNEQLRNENEIRLDKIRDVVENRLQILQKENSIKLEEMRLTVDEKLQSTVEKRFTESFKLISNQLEQVYKGLGEMQGLASNVGDLKKVLSNVKSRGVVGEFQLGMILEQFLSPKQYEHNACVKESSQERVEYAIKLPSKNNDNEFLLLPIDSKFPNEDYQRLVEVYDRLGDIDAKQLEAVNKQFENSVKKNAKDIYEKYLNPPTTTDFALMFVPTEGLYAEIIKRADLFEVLRRDYKVLVVGPTNLMAFVNSLQIGFRTIGVEKRASEIWHILGVIKAEFGKFGGVLDRAKKKLNDAVNVIDEASVRTRAIERKLKNVEEVSDDVENEIEAPLLDEAPSLDIAEAEDK